MDIWSNKMDAGSTKDTLDFGKTIRFGVCSKPGSLYLQLSEENTDQPYQFLVYHELGLSIPP